MAWYAGTRSEALLLGPQFLQFRARKLGPETHRLITTGEQGTQLIQALDAMHLRPDDSMELLAPDDDPAIRLRKLLGTIEQDARRHRSTHFIFSGFGPTAAACAMVAHARHCSALWLRPADPCGLLARSRWESGLARMIESLECVTVETCTALASDAVAASAQVEIEGRRPGAPLILVSVGRAEWGWNGVLGKLVHALAGLAAAMPEADILVLLSMDMRLHAPLRSLENRPPNLLSTSPLPPGDYAALLADAHVMLTDSPHVGADCIARGIPVLALGEITPNPQVVSHDLCRAITPDLLTSHELSEHIKHELAAPRPTPTASRKLQSSLTLEKWLASHG